MRWLRAVLISLLISLLVGLAIGTWIRLQLEAPISYIGYIGYIGQLREPQRPNGINRFGGFNGFGGINGCGKFELRSCGYLPRGDHSMSGSPARAFSARANTKNRSDSRLM